MGIHQRFGENLRNRCYNYSSISEVCKGIDINRQQFNKYLAGQSMPNATTLRRICSFLGTSEESLFAVGESSNSQSTPETSPVDQSRSIKHDILRNFAEGIRLISNGNLKPGTNVIKSGSYYCYFPLQNSETFLVRSLIKIGVAEGITWFSRLTVFPSRSGSSRYLARAKHAGIVVTNSKEIYFLGFNKSSPFQPSFLAFDKMNSGMPDLLAGLAITRTGTVLFSGRTCLQYLGSSINVRQALRNLGPVSTDSPTVGSFVAASMTAKLQHCANQLMAIGFDEILSLAGSALYRHPHCPIAILPKS